MRVFVATDAGVGSMRLQEFQRLFRVAVRGAD